MQPISSSHLSLSGYWKTDRQVQRLGGGWIEGGAVGGSDRGAILVFGRALPGAMDLRAHSSRALLARRKTCRANTFRWPGRITNHGPSAQDSAWALQMPSGPHGFLGHLVDLVPYSPFELPPEAWLHRQRIWRESQGERRILASLRPIVRSLPAGPLLVPKDRRRVKAAPPRKRKPIRKLAPYDNRSVARPTGASCSAGEPGSRVSTPAALLWRYSGSSRTTNGA